MSGRGAEQGSDPFLPSDPAYWSGLKGRIVAAGVDTVDGYRFADRSRLEVGPRTATVLAACAAVAVLALWAFPPPPEARVAEPEGVLSRALLPDDPLATALLLDRPPSLAAWLVAGDSP